MKNYLKWCVTIASPFFFAGCGGYCVARGSLVRTPRGKKKIETISVGDTVFSYDETTGEAVRSNHYGNPARIR